MRFTNVLFGYTQTLIIGYYSSFLQCVFCPVFLPSPPRPDCARFCWRFIPVKTEIFLPAVIKCLFTGAHLIVGVFTVLLSLPYCLCLEATVSVIWSYKNKTELNE